jgi:carboxylate-amine ligase
LAQQLRFRAKTRGEDIMVFGTGADSRAGISFNACSEPTLGAEIELQVIDPETMDLAPGALRILRACEEHGVDGVTGEFLLSMLEVKSDVCASVSELRANLFDRLTRVRNAAMSVGYDLAMGGTHPFARPSMAAVSPGERYERIERMQGWLAYQEAVFGLHIHVGVPSGDAAIGVTNEVVEYLPHLLSLSASSPYWQGVDTSHVSSRMRMFRPSANSGIPVCLSSWREFEEYCEAMRETGAVESTKDMYWDIRPQPEYGTVEFRVFDVPVSLMHVLGLCALTKCLVVNAVRRLEQTRAPRKADPFVYWQANENRWLATRFGLQADCVRRRGAARDSIRNDCQGLIDSLIPLAEELGEAEFMRAINPDVNFETGAERQRRVFRQSGSWRAVVDDMRRHWAAELVRAHSEPDAKASVRAVHNEYVAAVAITSPTMAESLPKLAS